MEKQWRIASGLVSGTPTNDLGGSRNLLRHQLNASFPGVFHGDEMAGNCFLRVPRQSLDAIGDGQSSLSGEADLSRSSGCWLQIEKTEVGDSCRRSCWRRRSYKWLNVCEVRLPPSLFYLLVFEGDHGRRWSTVIVAI